MIGILLIGVKEELFNLNKSMGSDINSLRIFLNYLLPSYSQASRQMPT